MRTGSQRPNGLWRANHRAGTGTVTSRHFADRAKAQQWLDGMSDAASTRLAEVVSQTSLTPAAPREAEPGTVTQRPNGRWRVRYRNAAGREVARHFREKAGAERWLARISNAGPAERARGTLQSRQVASSTSNVPTPAMEP